MNQSNDKFVVRMPVGLRDRIRREAEVNRRSMNGEIVYRLEQALPDLNETKGPAEAATSPSRGSINPVEGNENEHGD